MTALDAVIEGARQEVARLEKEEEDIMTNEGPDSPLLMDIYDRCVWDFSQFLAQVHTYH
jgi:hypothetical protein